MNNVELLAAQTLLQKGFKVKIPAPFWLRFFFIKNISVRLCQPTLGTMYRICNLLLRYKIDPDNITKVEPNCLKAMARITAVMLLNSWFWGWLLTPMLAGRLLRNLSINQLASIMLLYRNYNSVENFIHTIRLLGGMKITTPNLSQEEQGS